MKKATFGALQKALESANIESLLNEVLENEEDEKSYGLSFNVETDELKFIPYLTDEDKTFENAFEMQNPCIIIGYISQHYATFGDPATDIIERYLNSLKS